MFDFPTGVVAGAPEPANAIRQLGVTSAIQTIPNPVRTDRFFASAAFRSEGRRLLGLAPARFQGNGGGMPRPQLARH